MSEKQRAIAFIRAWRGWGGITSRSMHALHRDEPEAPVGPVIKELNKNLAEGRVRAIGATNWSYRRIQDANDNAESLASVKLKWPKLERERSWWNVKFVEENSTIIVNPLVRHNLFMPPYTVTHVVKYGKGCTKDDWFPSISLDNITMHILESDLVQMREQSHVNSRSTTSGLMGMEL